MAKLLLIDGDELLHRNLVALEHEVRWDWDLHSLHVNEHEAQAVVQTKLNELFDLFKPLMTVVAFSDKDNFRKRIDPSYKANRVGQRKPLCFSQFRQEMLKGDWRFVNGVSLPSLEADDLLAIAATKPGNEDHVLVSQDKDFNGVPCVRFVGERWPGNASYRAIRPAEADRFHLFQTLVGDKVDGYAGCPGVGPVKAEAIVDGGWKAVVKAYEKAGLAEADALVQARLARLVRWDEWDNDKQEVKLWEPK